MRYKPDRQGMAKFLNGPEVLKICTEEATRRLAKMKALVAKDTGETATSGHLEFGRGVKGDRPAVRIVFEGASTQRQWGVRGQSASYFMTRALEGD